VAGRFEAFLAVSVGAAFFFLSTTAPASRRASSISRAISLQRPQRVTNRFFSFLDITYAYTYNMHMMRTTILMDPESRRAARELALHHDCSVSEAIRRAVLEQRAAMAGVSHEARRERTKALRRLFDLFAGNDAEAEVARLKAEDKGF
jgi:hypothetical protein